MKKPGLTAFNHVATHGGMAGVVKRGVTAGQSNRRIRQFLVAPVVVLVSVAALSACVSVTAPDKPIVIELNINIKQEVIYRLAADANATIESNREIF